MKKILKTLVAPAIAMLLATASAYDLLSEEHFLEDGVVDSQSLAISKYFDLIMPSFITRGQT